MPTINNFDEMDKTLEKHTLSKLTQEIYKVNTYTYIDIQ